MKLVRDKVQITRMVMFHGLKVRVPIDTKYLAASKDGRVRAYTHKPRICMLPKGGDKVEGDVWVKAGRHSHVVTVAEVEFEGTPGEPTWQESLIKLEVEA